MFCYCCARTKVIAVCKPIKISPFRPPPISHRMSSNLNRPSPPPLPRDQQREFEELLRTAQAPSSAASSSYETAEAELSSSDARHHLGYDFDGDVNPMAGEEGGPKREPVCRWGNGDGDWSFKGRVSDF